MVRLRFVYSRVCQAGVHAVVFQVNDHWLAVLFYLFGRVVSRFVCLTIFAAGRVNVDRTVALVAIVPILNRRLVTGQTALFAALFDSGSRRAKRRFIPCQSCCSAVSRR